MSHVSSAKAKIEAVNESLLQQVLKWMAEKYGAKLVSPEKLKDYYGNPLKARYPGIKYGIQGGRFRYGVGIEIMKDGSVAVRGDFYDSGMNVQRFSAELESEYTKTAVQYALMQIGYSIVGVQEEKDEILITAIEGGM